MNFKGRAKRLDDIDLPRLGAEIGCGEDELHAVLDVETRGTGFDDQGRPRILFERHKFYEYVSADKRTAAVNAGLASKTSGGYGKESEQYAKLERAMKIDERAALFACSWGLPQIMGFNHLTAGYPTVHAMIEAFKDDEENQLAAMVRFIKNNKLDDNLRARDWDGFALGYNGKGYKKHNYHGRLAESFAKWSRIKDTPWKPGVTAEVAEQLPAAVTKETEVITVAGPKKDETTVLITQNADNPPASPQIPTKPTGIVVLLGLVGALATAVWNYIERLL